MPATDLTRLLARAAQADPELGGSIQLLDATERLEPNSLLPAIVHGLGQGEARQRRLAHLGRFYPPDLRVFPLDPPAGLERTTLMALPEQTQAVLLPAVSAATVTSSPSSLRAIIHRLRAPGGCPWDREQTPASLARYVTEEAAEVVDAIEDGDPAHLAEELGDLLLQVYLLAEIAEETEAFDLNDVMREIADKLVRRHPHVFAGRAVSGAAEVELNWEALKVAERGSARSAVDGVPRALPALARARELQRKLVRAGFDWPDRAAVQAKLSEELLELQQALGNPLSVAEELGDVMFMLVRLGSDEGVDAEAALRAATTRVERRYRWVERRAEALGLVASSLPVERLLELWREAKEAEREVHPQSMEMPR
jgi:MazG family protein